MENIIFVEFEDASMGLYYLPARVVTDQSARRGHIWVQYFIPDDGPLLQNEMFERLFRDNAENIQCKLLPLRDEIDTTLLMFAGFTVSYAWTLTPGCTFLCYGLYCGDRLYLPLVFEEAKFKRQIAQKQMMDVEIFYGEKHLLQEWTDMKPSVATYLQKIMY